MRKIRDVLRLRLAAGLSIRQIKASTKVSVGAIQKLLARAEEERLSWPLPPELDDDSRLARLFYPGADTRVSTRYQVPDWPSLHQALKRKGVTKQLLWEEYTRQYPNRCYSYSQFCERYARWKGLQKRSMRQIHKAGEKCFVDYAGQTLSLVCPQTGEIREAQIFVAVLGASNYTYAEASLSQSLPDWLGSHVRAFEYFGGTTAIVVPDNLKSGVTKACRYDPQLNASYQQLAEHYQLAVVPARPYKPRDKAKAEVGVQIVERWILARLRHHSFFSLAELNRCIRTLLEELNNRPFKQLPGNRREAFEQLDKPALRPLPRHPYRFVDIKPVKVNIDYHVQYQQHHYSVPHQYVGETLELRHPCPRLPARHHHRAGPYAQTPPPTPAVDAGAVKELGKDAGPRSAALGYNAAQHQGPPRAGLPPLPRPAQPEPRVSRPATRGRLPDRQPRGSAPSQADHLDTAQQSRSAAGAARPGDHAPPGPRKHPRSA
jgi:transposase